MPLAYHSTCNAFFMDLQVFSFVLYSSLLTVTSVDLVVACDGFLCVKEIVCIFHSGYFTFCTVLFCTTLRTVMNTSLSDIIEARGTIALGVQ